jgi:hypothetical protein
VAERFPDIVSLLVACRAIVLRSGAHSSLGSLVQALQNSASRVIGLLVVLICA